MNEPDPCTIPGHVRGCPGAAGGDHEPRTLRHHIADVLADQLGEPGSVTFGARADAIIAAGPRPLVLVDITEGCEQARWTFAGIGEPIVEVQDFDASDIDDEQREYLADRADLFAELLTGRGDSIASAAHYAELAADWREDLAENRRTAAADLAAAEAKEARIAAIAEAAGMAPGELVELFGR